MSRWRPARRAGAPWFAALLVAAAALLAAPNPAAAHAELASSTPAANSTLKQAPTILVLAFTEPVDASTSSIHLLDELQQRVNGVGSTTVADGGRGLTTSLPHLTPGVYEVSYRVTSAVDGHVTVGVFAFRFDPTGTLPPPETAASATSPSADPPTVAARWAALVLLLLLFGTALFWLVAARPALDEAAVRDADDSAPVVRSPPWRALAAIGAAAVMATVAFLWLAAAPVVADRGSATGGIFPDPASAFGWTSFGIAMRVTLLGAAAATLVAVLAAVLRRGAAGFLGALLTMVLVSLGGLSFAGHAAAGGGPVFAAIDTLHLVGVAAWLGTLGGLAALAWRLRSSGGKRRQVVGAALARHSRVALVAAPVVALTGLANSPIVLGEAREAVASDYGNLVLAKAALFSVAIAIGSVNYLLARRRSLGGVAVLIGGEAIVGLVAVAVAATMVSIQPGASRVPQLSRATNQTAHVYLATAALQIHAAIDIPSPGDQLYEVAVADAIGAPTANVEHVLLDFLPPSGSGLAVRRATLAPTVDPTVWAAQGAYTPTIGSWTIRVVIHRKDQPDETASFPIQVQMPIAPQLVAPPDTGIGVPAPLAALWVLPNGVAGWALVAIPLLGVIGLWLLPSWRRGRGTRSPRGFSGARAILAGVALVAGLGVGSRAVVEAANRPASVPANPVAATADSIARGELIYRANCSSCHGLDGNGNGPQAAGMLPAPGAIGTVVSSSGDGTLYSLLTNGVAGTRMPAFATPLSENDRWDLVNDLHRRWPLEHQP